MKNSHYMEIESFIREIYKSEEKSIPLHAPVFVGNEKKYLSECIDSTFVSYVGKFVTEFEAAVRTYVGSKYSIAVVNGTVALQIAMQVSGVLPGDEVITTALTFVATANAISHIGATPLFVDSSEKSLGLCPVSLNEFLKKNAEIRKDGYSYNKLSGRRISACVPVHIFGHPVEITEIEDVCRNYNLTIIEDAAESLGSYYNGKHTGTFGKAGILSFNGNKLVTTGGGGMIITDDPVIADRARYITTTAKVPHPYEFFHDEIGYNFRMPNVNAAIGLAQMEKLPEFLKLKREVAARYGMFFEKLANQEIKFITEPEYARSNYWLNAILVKNRKERDTFLEYMNKRNIQVRPAWTLMTKLPMYKNSLASDLTNAKSFEDRIVNLPSSVATNLITA